MRELFICNLNDVGGFFFHKKITRGNHYFLSSVDTVLIIYVIQLGQFTYVHEAKANIALVTKSPYYTIRILQEAASLCIQSYTCTGSAVCRRQIQTN